MNYLYDSTLLLGMHGACGSVHALQIAMQEKLRLLRRTWILQRALDRRAFDIRILLVKQPQRRLGKHDAVAVDPACERALRQPLR